MSKEGRKNFKLFKDEEFETREQAGKELDKLIRKVKRGYFGIGFGVFATIFGFLGWFLEFDLNRKNDDAGMILLLLAFIFTIVAYILAGGLWTAIVCAFRLGIFGWIVVPFPIDIITGVFTMLFALWAFFTMPIVFVLIGFFHTKKRLSNARMLVS